MCGGRRPEQDTQLTRQTARFRVGALYSPCTRAATRERGYAQAIGEIEEGLHGVAAPVRGADGTVVAALSVSGPSYRIAPDRLREFGALAIAAAARISNRLGYYG